MASILTEFQKKQEQELRRRASAGEDVRQYENQFNQNYIGGLQRGAEQKRYANKFEKDLLRYDETQGKFFDQMRAGFRQRSQSIASAQLSGGEGALQRSAAQRGLSFSGLEQAGLANLYGQVGAAQTQAQSEYDQRLSELQQTQRDAFVRGEFDYFNELQRMSYQHDLDKDLARFQAELADQYTSGWGQFFNVLGQGAGIFGGSYLQAAGSAMGGRR